MNKAHLLQRLFKGSFLLLPDDQVDVFHGSQRRITINRLQDRHSLEEDYLQSPFDQCFVQIGESLQQMPVDEECFGIDPGQKFRGIGRNGLDEAHAAEMVIEKRGEALLKSPFG